MRAFRHNHWNIFGDHQSNMPMVSVSEDVRISKLWENPRLVLAVGGESDERFTEYVRSWQWILVMQVFSPLFAIYTAAMAKKGFYDARQRHGVSRPGGVRASVDDSGGTDGAASASSPQVAPPGAKDQPWPIAAVVCAIEGPTLLLVAAALALGQHGPMLLPHAAHLVCNDLFLGVSLLTTVLVALYLHDEALKIDDGQSIGGASPPPPLPPTWVVHRRKLIAGSAFLTLSAAAPLGFIFVPSFWDHFGGGAVRASVRAVDAGVQWVLYAHCMAVPAVHHVLHL